MSRHSPANDGSLLALESQSQAGCNKDAKIAKEGGGTALPEGYKRAPVIDLVPTIP